MNWALEPVYLQDGEITIRPFDETDIEQIAESIYDPQGFFSRSWGVESKEDIIKMLKAHLVSFNDQKANPFIYLVNGEIAGISRFLNIDRTCRCLEIGGTWIAPKWRRTFLNTKVKFLLLQYVFEQLGAARAELRVNAINFRSQLAVLRIGAVFEGKLRHRTLPLKMQPHAMHCYSVIQPEWPKTKERLQALMAQQDLPPTYLPWQIKTARLQMDLYQLKDAKDLFELAVSNRNWILASFKRCGNFKSVQDAEAFIASNTHGAYAGTDFYYAIRLKNTEAQIGQFQIKQIDWSLRSVDLGYFIDAKYWRQGYAFEALWQACELLKSQQFNRITLRTLEDNLPSQKLAEKLGFKNEGLSVAAFKDGLGEIRNVYTYVLNPERV